MDYPGNKRKHFAYDKIGNRTKLIYRHDSAEDNYYEYQYNYNQVNNQLKSYALSEYTHYEYDYNANGSITGKQLIRGDETLQQTTYKYDLRNQLRQINIANNQAGVNSKVNFKYNSKGWRIKKDNGIETTYYLYGKGQQVLEERDGQGELERLFIYGNSGRLAVLDKDSQLHYVVSDQLGSTSVVTDEQGKEQLRYKYSPFGNLIRSEGNIKDSYRFTGKEFDGMTGLYYYGARYYDPALGRFITEDPVQDGGNWYVYAANNPLKYVDPDGLKLNKAEIVNRGIGLFQIAGGWGQKELGKTIMQVGIMKQILGMGLGRKGRQLDTVLAYGIGGYTYVHGASNISEGLARFNGSNNHEKLNPVKMTYKVTGNERAYYMVDMGINALTITQGSSSIRKQMHTGNRIPNSTTNYITTYKPLFTPNAGLIYNDIYGIYQDINSTVELQNDLE